MGGVGNGAAEEDWRWDLNPGMAAIGSLFGEHAAWAEKDQGLLFLFLRYVTRDWAEGEGSTVRSWVF